MIYIPKQLTSSEVMTEAFHVRQNVVDDYGLKLLIGNWYGGYSVLNKK